MWIAERVLDQLNVLFRPLQLHRTLKPKSNTLNNRIFQNLNNKATQNRKASKRAKGEHLRLFSHSTKSQVNDSPCHKTKQTNNERHLNNSKKIQSREGKT
jgi:hypothetical protein